MNILNKTLVGTVAAGAMALTPLTPAMARDRHDNGISAGDVIAGALIIGGIAAVASAASKDRDGRYYDRRGYDRRYDRRGYDRRGYDRRGYDDYGYRDNYRANPRRAVEKCVRAAERRANRYSHGRARVTDIRDVDRKRGGFRVKGNLIVNERNRGWRGDYGYSRGGRDYDRGRFTCDIRHGRVVDVDFRGIRGLY